MREAIEQLLAFLREIAGKADAKLTGAYEPVSKIVTGLFDQYVAEAKAAIMLCRLWAIVSGVVAAVTIPACMLFVSFAIAQVNVGHNPGWVIAAVACGITFIVSVICMIAAVADGIGRRGRMTSDAVDNLVRQARNLKGR